MKFSTCAASLIALALFAGASLAENQEQGAAPDPAVDVVGPAIPENILALINDQRAMTELSNGDLRRRVKAAREALNSEGLTDDVRDQLREVIEAARKELKLRQAGDENGQEQKAEPEPAAQPEQQAQPEATPEPAPQPEQQAQPAEPTEPAKPKLPKQVIELLNDSRSLDEMQPNELQQRAAKARRLSERDDLPQDVRLQLIEISRAARQAMQQQLQEEKPQQVVEPEPQPAPQPEPKAEPAPDTKVVEEPKPAQPDKVEAQQLDGNAGDPEAEKKARAFLEDPIPAESLSDDKLRERLDAMRDLMQGNALSLKTERALRKKLRADRQVIRERMARAKAEEEAKALAEKEAKLKAEAEKQQQAAAEQQNTDGKKPKTNVNIGFNIVITPDTPVRDILRDRRPSEDLEESELRRRINVYRDVEASNDYDDYDEDDRRYWRETIRRDREVLRRRLAEERNVRRIRLDEDYSLSNIRIDDDEVGTDFDEDLFAAEVEEDDIERALTSAPRKKVKRIARVEDIADSPQIRNALVRIEVDTIRFGFNEAFIREEEIENLDQVASVIEKVLRKYPREVFLIEGHTDAVGSDAYNLRLSKQRAEAVKKALTSFYVIPARNLKTVGLGERYLKIPTAEAEAENRRVSISRATAVVGEVDD